MKYEIENLAEALRRRLDEIAEQQGVTLVVTHPRKLAPLYACTELFARKAMQQAGFWRSESDGKWRAIAGAQTMEI